MTGSRLNALQPDSSELHHRLRAADWLGREFAYAEHIHSVDLVPNRVPPAAALIICLENPDKGAVVGLRMLLEANPESVQIIVVNPGNSSPLTPLFTSMAHARIDVDAACSPYAARNIGALFADAPVLCFLSDTVRPLPHLLTSYLACLTQKGVVAARGRITGKTDMRGSVFRRFDRTSIPHDWALDLDENMAMDTRTFFSLGGFDETLQPGYGAVDLSARIFALWPDPGAQQYCPEAEAELPRSGEPRLESLCGQISWDQINTKYAKDLWSYCVFWTEHFADSQKEKKA